MQFIRVAHVKAEKVNTGRELHTDLHTDTKKEGNEFPRSPQYGPYIGSVQNLHQLSAAEGDGLAGLDVLGLVAGDAINVGVIGGADLGDLVGLLLGQTLNAEGGGLVFTGYVHAQRDQVLVASGAVAHLDPESLQLGLFSGVLGGDLNNVLVNTDLHRANLDSYQYSECQRRACRGGSYPPLQGAAAVISRNTAPAGP